MVSSLSRIVIMSLFEPIICALLSVKWIKLTLIYVTSAFYTVTTALFLAYMFIRKYETKFWMIKSRPTPPKCLTDTRYGEHQFISNVNGIGMHYVEKGDRKNPLMLFVHGFPEFWYSWRFQLEEFSKDYWCVAIDLRGYGDTDKPEGIPNYNLDVMVEDIRDLIRHLGVEKFYLVGHDYGSFISFQYVAKYMDTIIKYVCMDAPPIAVYNKLLYTSWAQFKKAWYVFYFQAPYLPELTFGLNDLNNLKVIGDDKFSDTFTEEDLEAYKFTFGKPYATRYPIHYYRNFTVNKEPKTMPLEFSPGLYLMGERDNYLLQQGGYDAQKIYDNLEFRIVPGGNHFVQQNEPVAVNQMMREFLNKK